MNNDERVATNPILSDSEAKGKAAAAAKKKKKKKKKRG